MFVAQKLVFKLCNEQRKLLVIRKVATTIKDSVFELVIQILQQWQLYSKCEINKTTYTITMPNGSVILFKGLDDPEKIKSIVDITDIWCEEATELTEEDYDQLDLRLRTKRNNLQLISSFNPVSKVNWVYKRWFKEPCERKDTFILQTTYKDNKFLSPEYAASLEDKARTNPVYYRIYALGEFASLDKLVYTNWRVEEFDSAAIQGTLAIGLDFGFTNDISALVASIITEDKIYVFRT